MDETTSAETLSPGPRLDLSRPEPRRVVLYVHVHPQVKRAVEALAERTDLTVSDTVSLLLSLTLQGVLAYPQ